MSKKTGNALLLHTTPLALPLALAMALSLALALTAPAPLAALDGGWAAHAGVFDTGGSDQPVELGVEGRFSPFTLWTLELQPVLGVTATADESFWVYGGVRTDFRLSDRWRVTPSFAVALYEEGDGKELGGVVEFRSGIELAYRLGNGSHLGILFYHLSNAGIYDQNPGANSLVLTWSFGG